MPLFRAAKPYALLTINGSLTGYTQNTPITWSLVEDEDPSVWSSGTPTIYTVAKAGLYYLRGTLASNVCSSTTSNHALNLEVNNTPRIQHTILENRANGVVLTMSVSLIRQLDVGDTVRIVAQWAGGTRTLVGPSTRMELVRIGPVKWT